MKRAGDEHPTRVAIVGAGSVGATFAYTLLLSGLAAEIVLVDSNRTRAEGEAMDLGHAVPFGPPAHVWAGDYEDCAGAVVTVVAAGAAQKPGETRLELAGRNAAIIQEVAASVARVNPNGILLVATNPVDLLTYAAWKSSGLPARRVIGSGTVLDTARFRYLLGRHFGVDPRSVHAFVVGEHGDSEVPVWSLANIAGMRLPAFCAAQGLAHDTSELDDIFRRTREAAYAIIERKGATYYAVAAGLVRIVEAILRDQRTVLSVSSLIDGYYGVDDVCLSLPTVVSREGVERVLRPDLDPEEIEGLRRSAAVLKEALAGLEPEGA
ncbi:L-lactate dehydrogenase [Rubrobacter tropicus]|uniref:L-lactate dehydrogenase n=1 Tax=Rubrobacter tropicus TaxID=2653851 RepID=A0A6G8QDD3_9ACTN|nr:L-lactate dehydrogenase [Rubrobacter tropicus]QIN84463.1 L-lactate dehydrogenase [Rubrobacter tropicus]